LILSARRVFGRRSLPLLHLVRGATTTSIPWCQAPLILGHRDPRLIDVAAVLTGFNDDLGEDARQRYLAWVRAVAEARWMARGIEDLPWWKGARDADEIVEPARHPEARTFDGHSLKEERSTLALGDFTRLFEYFSGHSIPDLSSPLRNPTLIRGRIEFKALGVSRYGLRSVDIASLINKHPSSLTRWLNLGLIQEREYPIFRARLNSLDQQVSAAAGNNASMRRVAP